MINEWAKPNLESIPELEGFAEHYGCKVSSIGEDGGMIILGHAGRLRAIAAMSAYARNELGYHHLDLLNDLWCNENPDFAHTWMRNKGPETGGDWYLVRAQSNEAGAFPVTEFNPDWV